MADTPHKVVIIGSGPAGLTAAVYAARANLHPLVIDGKTPGGQLMGTTVVENWPGEKSILGPQLMINMREHAKHFGTTFLEQSIVKVDFKTRPFLLTTDRDQHIQAHAVIIATGAIPNRLKCPGEDTYWGKGVTSCTVCDGAFYKDKEVVIVGGGDSAMEGASFMRRFTDKITIVHILDTFTASYAMQQRVLNNDKIKIMYSSTVTHIDGDGEHVTGVTVTHQQTKQETSLATSAVFISIGLTPNTTPFKEHLMTNKLGYLTVTQQTNTSVKGVFAAGDVHDYRYKQAITSAGDGCMAALDAERYLENGGSE